MIPIHNHPQKKQYNDSTEWPTISPQGHWLVNGEMAHIHVDMNGPMYGEFNPGDLIDCNFAITLHHFPGRVTAVYPGFQKFPSIESITWEETGNSNQPVMIGNPTGDKVWRGKFTSKISSRLNTWWFLTLEVTVQFNNGDQAIMRPMMPIWTNGQGNEFSYHLPVVGSRFEPFSKSHPEIKWGQVSVEQDDFLPIVQFDTDYKIKPAWYSYGRVDLKSSENEIRYDLDLHNGIPGNTVFRVVQPGDVVGTVFTINPTMLGTGKHKMALIKTQQDGDEIVSALLVSFLNIGEGIPVPPDPTPIPDWKPVSVMIEKLEGTERYRIHDDSIIKEFQFK